MADERYGKRTLWERQLDGDTSKLRTIFDLSRYHDSIQDEQ